MFHTQIDITVMSWSMCNCKLILQDANQFNLSKYRIIQLPVRSHKDTYNIYMSMSFDVEFYVLEVLQLSLCSVTSQ